jgi:hypothetical protein
VVLFLVSTVSFMERQILAILLEPIEHDLGVSDTEMLCLRVVPRAIPGHSFGLALSADDKQALIAFLRSL